MELYNICEYMCFAHSNYEHTYRYTHTHTHSHSMFYICCCVFDYVLRVLRRIEYNELGSLSLSLTSDMTGAFEYNCSGQRRKKKTQTNSRREFAMEVCSELVCQTVYNSADI